MQTRFDSAAKTLPRSLEADGILRSCVHCGLCNATCPTYQLLGDELDGPRGRIYLIKQMLEGGEVTAATQTHLDRCLTCRSCETTCPSGVQYHSLLDIGREEIARRVPRKLAQRIMRGALRHMMGRPRLFASFLWVGQRLRPLVPTQWRGKIPRRAHKIRPQLTRAHARKVLMLEGCVQRSLAPNTNAAAARVLDRLGIEVGYAPAASCCGAIDYHLDAQADGLKSARRNIDAWWPMIEAGAEAIVQTASGCGAFIKDYGHLLRNDSNYAIKAQRISAMALDLVEVVRREPLEPLRLSGMSSQSIAVHTPCTLQHGQRLDGAIEALLEQLGFNILPITDAHLCCGSAGTYSLTQAALATMLRDNKLAALQSGAPQQIVTANIGCQIHLGAAASVPVRHWIELLDESLK